ncbi:cation diffusion facilitator family transporter [Soonwooa buanensis]|uniref:Cation diffusion facilitator family transporter n=1 Tax=Soonwooa buanensis TaxID=619805 RepID=A0A1T5E499_9FLAO|nr:cation diffusion facilitator family transporter [Soonwooa buanensis]SKB78715.1 cation diffusion facilitator family transporter [Soonwooa buanensis]
MNSSGQNISKNNFRFQRNVAIIGIVLFVAKLIAWRLTNSDAVFSDAMESIVNIIAAFMGLYSLYVAAKPKDEDHPYGHGKVEFITSGVEGTLIIFAGVVIIVQAVNSLLSNNIPGKLDWGMLIVAITAIINYVMGYISLQKGLKEKSLVLQSSGKHLMSDTITTGGVVLSLIIVYFTKIYWLDAIVALAFGVYIIYIGYKIVRKSLSGIMDEQDIKLVEKVADILEKNREEDWIDVHNMKIQQFGANLHIDAHITLPYYYSLREAHQEMEKVILVLAKNAKRQIEFNFHMDDCKPKSCEVCQLKNCPVREKEFLKRITWTAQNITQPDKHDRNN